jgi:hypothetical protein
MPYLTMLPSWCGTCGSKRHRTRERAKASKCDRARERARARVIQRQRLRAYYTGSLPPDRPIFIRSYLHRRSHPPNLKFRASFFRA